MQHVRDIQPVQLPARALHRIEGGKGLQITAVSGVVWVTQARDNRDVILAKGQTFLLDRPGLAVVYALREAAIVVGPAGHITAVDFDPAATRSAAA